MSSAKPPKASHGTKPRPTDEAGRELDEWGLPLCGPARLRKLAELNLPDPNHDPKAWRRVKSASAEGADQTDGGAAQGGADQQPETQNG